MASRSATDEVERRTLAGSQATAGALAGQVRQAYADTLKVLERAGDRLAVMSALSGGDAGVAQRSLANLLETSPVDGVAFYDVAGGLTLEAHIPGARTPVLPAVVPSSGLGEDPVEPRGRASVRGVSGAMVDKVGRRVGTFVADIDVSRLVTDPSTLRFGRTGVSYLVGTDARILIGGDPATVGTNLLAPTNQRVARAHVATTLITFSRYYRTEVVEAYVPIPGAPWGVLTLQFTAEAFAGAHGLSHRLRLMAAAFAALGTCITLVVWAMVARRDRRISRQEVALAEADELFRSAFDDAPTGVALVGLDGRYLRVNRSLCEIVGHPEAYLLGAGLADLTHPDDEGLGEQALAAFNNGDMGSARLEKRYVHADGHPIWVSIHASVVCDAAGRPNHLVSHVVDVSDRHHAVAALAEAESRYRTMVTSLHEGIVVHGIDGTIIAANESAARIVGLTMDELLTRTADRPPWRLVDTDEAPIASLESPAARALASGEPLDGVLVGVDHPDGSIHWLSQNVHPLSREGEDGFHAVLVSFTDVTVQRRAEAVLERQALFDALTGAANRDLIGDRIEQALARAARRPDSSVAVLFVDLDEFKPINDRFGHSSGDLVLQVVARRLAEGVRDEDTVGRLGGDEFCVVLEGVSEHDAAELAARLVAAIEHPIAISERGTPHDVRVGASIGVAFATETMSPGDLIDRADAAMYEAKRRRRVTLSS